MHIMDFLIIIGLILILMGIGINNDTKYGNEKHNDNTRIIKKLYVSGIICIILALIYYIIAIFTPLITM